MNKHFLNTFGAAVASALALSACAPPVASLAADAAYTASEERTTDEVVDDNKLKVALNKRLLDDDVELFKNVSTVVYQGRVLLLGAVETEAAKARAAALVADAEAVREVINEIQVTDEGGLRGFANDLMIEKKIQSALLFDKTVKSANYRVRSVNGVVYLIGLAESRAELERVLAKTRATNDVREVVNYVRVKPAKT